METLKNKIKELAALQPLLKNQRKTVKLVGKRTLSTSAATYQHYSNRDTLRHLYMAYGLLRGKTQEEVESNSVDPINMDYVDKLIEQYKPIEVKKDGE